MEKNTGLRDAVCEVDGANQGRKIYLEKQIPIKLMRRIAHLEGLNIDFTDADGQYGELYAVYAEVIPVWELVRMNRKTGHKENLPNPVEDPMVFDELSIDELMWISGEIWGGASNPTTNGQPSSSISTEE
jgi:hypothetical protein